jgi:hypothetical protein
MRSDHAHHGLNDLKARSLLETMRQRRTHRVSRGSRFPAHVDAVHVPGIWLQVQQVEQ